MDTESVRSELGAQVCWNRWSWHRLALLGILGFFATAALPAQAVNEFPLPKSGAPWGIAAGPDGALWFTDFLGQIGRITTGGAITEYAVAANPYGIVAGPDSNLWFDPNTRGQMAVFLTKTFGLRLYGP